MNKECNIITRSGNKESDIKYFKHLLPSNFEMMVEPFAGSFALSKYMYDDNKKFHINDLDHDLYYIYKNYEKYIKIIKDIKEDSENYDLKIDCKKFIEYIKTKQYDSILLKYWIEHTIIRGYTVSIRNSTNYNKNEIKILNSATITNKDYMEILKQYKDNENVFIFLDPPYLFSNNETYIPQNTNSDNTRILIDTQDFMKTCKCKVMLVINKLDIITYLFKEFHKIDYIRIYQIGKKKSIHSVFCNY